MLRHLNKSIFLTVALVLTSCHGCKKPLSSDSAGHLQKIDPKPSEKFELSPEAMAKIDPDFSYQSSLAITLKSGDKSRETIEKIAVLGEKSRIHFKKQADAHHFFEIFKEDDKFFVKDRFGPWHKSHGDKSMYHEVIYDGLNLTAWMIDQFVGVADVSNLYDKTKSEYVFNDFLIQPNSTFLSDIRSKTNEFKNINKASLNGRIAVDSSKKIVRSAHLEALISAQDNNQIRLVADVAWTRLNYDQVLNAPEVAEEKPVNFPVNIKPKFEEIMKSINGESGHE